MQPALWLRHALLTSAVGSTGLAIIRTHNDNASGNDLFSAATCGADPPSWAKHVLLCMSHQHHLALLTLFGDPFALSFVGTLLNISGLLHMGTYMLKMGLAVRRSLASPGCLCIECGRPPPQYVRFRSELMAYHMVHSVSKKKKKKKKKKRTKKKKKK
eukprot:NODE_9146_length_1444_cov_4.129081.p1 GENE.NODE_9146_length_1444_cov_4.129081~~NODE_9146_length_1444_cov_4.129081.p1  ORF type:complete len:158 (-),score=45.32 NODE_9146_length_1444_cov_4.129081:139-612(-)